MNRTAIAIATAAACLLTVCLTTPATAAPTPPSIPGYSAPVPTVPLSPQYYADPTPLMPNCKQISTASALRMSTSRFSSVGDLSDFATHTGYGTQLTATHAIIEDGGYSCTYLIAGSKNQLTISVTPVSQYDRDTVLSRYLAVFGTTPSSIGGTNVYLGGRGPTWREVSFLLEEGVWVSGKVRSDADFFPAVLQNVSDMVYELNH